VRLECAPNRARVRHVSGRAGHTSVYMQVQLLKSKIHRAGITGASLDYEGSLTISRDLMDRVGLLPFERVLCSNLANGNRFETYAIPGDPGTFEIILNGAAAHQGKIGDLLTIMSFGMVDEPVGSEWHPRVIVLGTGNQVVNERGI
jgi:aspartate 1-decarboxylase